MEKKLIELIFIPAPGVGHMISMVEMAKLIVVRDQRISITIFLIKRPGDTANSDMGSFTKSLSLDVNFDQTRIRFIDLREPDPDSVAKLKNTAPLIMTTIELQNPIIREVIAIDVIGRPNSGKFGGILVDLFFASLVDVAKEFDVPSYIYVPCSASLLGLMYYMNALREEQGKDESEFMNSDALLQMRIFSNPFPAKLLPLSFIDKSCGSTIFLDLPRKINMASGIVINTSSEIESSAIRVLSNQNEMEYEDPIEVLPEGFLERTGEMGKLIGWASQVEVQAVGGFVSHCGWNSMLERFWSGVPMATWPLYAEQHMNAFVLVNEMEMGVEVKMDYRKSYIDDDDDNNIVEAMVIENAIQRLMDGGMRNRVKETSQKFRSSVIEGGSAYISLGRFIDDVIKNIS